MEKVTLEDGQSANIVDENTDMLKKLFPDAFAEGKLDFDVLRQLLGDASVLDEGEEKYGLNWHGKKQARQIALTPSTGTLLPCPEESVDWDKTQNLYVEGDNLEVLKLLQKSYAGQLTLVIIDPPYNTGNEFIYPDNFKENLDTYLRYTGQKSENGLLLASNTESSGRFHATWLNMMYSRLKLAKSLLRQDGAIFSFIGDSEVSNLKIIMDNIFGAENFVSLVPRVAKRTSDKGTHFRPTKDYILVYAKDKNFLPEFGIRKNPIESDYKFSSSDGRKYKQSGASLYQPSLDSRPNQRYYIEAPDGSLIIPPGNVFPDEKRDGEKVRPKTNADKVWRWSVATYQESKDKLIFTKASDRNPLLDENGNQSKWNIYPKVFYDEDIDATLHPEDIIYDYPNSQATKELNSLSIPFSFSKPTGLIEFLMSVYPRDDHFVMDFFSGSATTAHAVLKMNAKDGGKRRFIMVQLPEPCDENSQEFKDGFKNISEIGKERIRRAASKIRSEHPELKGDLGFKVFKLADSNINAWNPDRTDLEATLLSHKNHLAEGRSEQDVLYELLLKRGIELTVPIEQKMAAGKTLYSIGYGVLFACLDASINAEEIEAVAQGILKWHKELEPETDSYVFFRDSAFADDITKTNMAAILEQNGISHVRSL